MYCKMVAIFRQIINEKPLSWNLLLWMYMRFLRFSNCFFCSISLCCATSRVFPVIYSLSVRIETTQLCLNKSNVTCNFNFYWYLCICSRLWIWKIQKNLFVENWKIALMGGFVFVISILLYRRLVFGSELNEWIFMKGDFYGRLLCIRIWFYCYWNIEILRVGTLICERKSSIEWNKISIS